MVKRLVFVILPVSATIIVGMLWLPRWHSTPKTPAVPVTKTESAPPTRPISPMNAAVGLASDSSAIKERIWGNAAQHRSPAGMAAMLKKVYAENPDGLFNALLTMGRESLETRQRVLPFLTEALLLWPEAEGRYVFPIADAYAETNLPAAAEWGAAFLVKTARSDLAASSLLGRLSAVSEERALALIATLPEEARRDAIHSVAYHIQIGDLKHLMQVCVSLDTQGISTFSKQLFERLGMERLNETAAWLLITPEAARIPGAIPAIKQALVVNHGDKMAMAWADALPDVNPAAQAITTIYPESAKESPERAIKDIPAVYDGAPQLMADVFKGAAERHGSSAAGQ